jgi:hypothetical protein
MFPDDYQNVEKEPYLRSALVKYRDIVAETCQEYSRRGEFVRIYPAKNSKMYDKYFSRSAINKIVYKFLFGPDLMPYEDQQPSSLSTAQSSS